MTGALVCAGGALLGWFQTWIIYDAVAYCVGPQHLDAGASAGIFFESIARIGLYAGFLTALAAPVLVLAARRNTVRWLTVTVAAVSFAAAIIFVLDHATTDKVTPFAESAGRSRQAAQRCPEGQPSSWPHWLP
ncbi:hypothetical protein [Krasilnikovia sp. MM14-A1004]|uniref:hypothetical protein n=1 Tax=Krasilnikovia sp. MM14-A1004 TaxID=3373541 RepID=UPI00399C7851